MGFTNSGTLTVALRAAVLTIVATLTCLASPKAQVRYELDLSHADMEPGLKTAINQNVPQLLAKDFMDGTAPEVVGSFIHILPYQRFAGDTSSHLLFVYFGGEVEGSTLQMIRKDGDSYHFLTQDSTIIGGMLARLKLFDVDCDGINEVLVSRVGTAGWDKVDVIKIEGLTMRNMSQAWFGGIVRGGFVKFERDTAKGCNTKIEYDIFGSRRFEAIYHKVFRFDPAVGKAALVRVDTMKTDEEQK